MELQLACRVAQGPRASSDDRALLLGRILDRESCSGQADTPLIAAVCDGCGGYAGGGLAAETVLSVLSRTPPETLTEPGKLAETLEAARRAVDEKSREEPRFSQMCTTVAGCVFLEDRTLIFHAGDSRVYRYDGTSLARMTVDHSAVQSMVDAGRISAEDGRSSPQRNVITRCIGMDCPPPEIYVSHSPILPGETFLLCSDGFWDCVPDGELKELLRQSGSPAEQVERLVEYALRAGSDDNVTVCLCACRGGARPAAEAPFVLD